MTANEVFTDYLNSLPDSYYFLIANIVLGKVSTPFHKPVLNAKILSFLLNADNRKAICASLDESDIRLLTFLHLAGPVRTADLHSFFSVESYTALLSALENLRDRLLVIGTGREILINPVLEGVLVPRLDSSCILGNIPRKDDDSPCADRNVVSAMLSLFAGGSVPAREANTHNFLKSGKLSAVFPQFRPESSALLFSSLRSLFLRTGALSVEEGRYIICRSKAAALLEQDVLNTALLCMPAERREKTASFLGILRSDAMEAGTAKSLLSIMLRMPAENANDVLKLLECFGIIRIDDESVHFNEGAFRPAQTRESVHADTDYVLSYYGAPPSDDILYLFADIVICDKLISYRLSRDSFQRALEAGVMKDEIRTFLGPQARMFPLDSWEQTFSRVRLYDGILIKCDGQLQKMICAHPGLQEHILAVPSDGMVVMNRSTARRWQEILSYSLDMKHLPIPVGEQKRTEAEEEENLTYSVPEEEKPAAGSGPEDPEKLRQRLMEDARKKGCLTDNVKALIDGHLIISESQIEKNNRYASRISISGFDYSAKLTALKRMLKSGATLLELELTDSTVIGAPIELVKDSGGSEILRVRTLPEDSVRSIPVSSLFRITELRWSLSQHS